MNIDQEEQIKAILTKQSEITAKEVANICANLCDSNMGNLAIGEMIREMFKLPPKEENKPTKLNLSIVKNEN